MTVPPGVSIQTVRQEGRGGEAQLVVVTHTATDNPLNQTCITEPGTRKRGIGTGEVVGSSGSGGVLNTIDSIAYTFFSYGNVKALSNSNDYGYVTLNNIDPIFASYGAQSSTGNGFDPGQPPNASNPTALPGTLPNAVNTPCGAFPCAENKIWAGGLSFPNLRNGTYPAWSIVRLVSSGTALANAKTFSP